MAPMPMMVQPTAMPAVAPVERPLSSSDEDEDEEELAESEEEEEPDEPLEAASSAADPVWEAEEDGTLADESGEGKDVSAGL